MDADLQHPPSYIPQFISVLRDIDLVSGSRYLPDSLRVSPPPEDRLYINRHITRELNRHLGLGITDAFCGFKAYKRKVLEVPDITENGYGMPIQVWIQVFVHKIKIQEVPVPLIYPDSTRFSGVELDSPQERLQYYMRVFEKEMKRWKLKPLQSARIPMMQK